MTRSATPHGAQRAHSTATSGHGRRVRSDRAPLGTVLLTWWLVAVLVTTPLQCSLHCLLLTGHGAGHHHVAAFVGDGVGTGVAFAGGLCHLAASPHIHALPAAALQAVPTVLSFLPLSVLLPVLLTLIGAGAARCRAWRAALPGRDPAYVRPLAPPPRPVAG
jgi:hypothetical protein